MKKYMMTLLAVLLLTALAGCGNNKQAGQPSAPVSNETEKAENTGMDNDNDSISSEQESSGNVLVAYFAYSENMGDTSGMDVDAITSASLNRPTDNTEGNLQIMAQVIEEKEGADIFHILMTEPYASDYSTMLPTAIDQMENEDWPSLQGKIENLDDYDVIYLGLPVWNAEIPPALHTFLAENDLSGKTVVPFGIHLGSRFGRMIDQIKDLAPDATVVEGVTVNAETANEEVRSQFSEWMDENR